VAAGAFQRHDSILGISRNSLDLDFDATSSLKGEDAPSYWNSVRKLIIEVIGDEEVDAFFFLGENNKDAKFRGVIKERASS
jgi:hypothetical protein